jgi:hypothetical protein
MASAPRFPYRVAAIIENAFVTSHLLEEFTGAIF